jgi:hypothetical protein
VRVTAWREFAAPPIAGIPITHVVSDAIRARPNPVGASFRGSRAVDAELRIVHEIGGTDTQELRLMLAGAAPIGTYFLDDTGEPAVQSVSAPNTGGVQLLRTRRRGYEYAITYHTDADVDVLQWHWLRTIFMLALPSRGRGLIAHGCAVLLPSGDAVLCPGVSGAGKSTLARLFAREFGGEVRVLSDDRVAVTIEGDGLRLWGTPWNSSAGAVSGDDGPLAAVVFIRQGGSGSLSSIGAREARARLLRCLALPFWSSELMNRALSLAAEIVGGRYPLLEYAYSPIAGVRPLVKGLGALWADG